MGTWGIGTFDDDTACDWLDEFAEEPSVEFLQQTLAAPDDGYLELDQCTAFLAAAEIIAGVVAGPRPGLPKVALGVIASLAPDAVGPLRSLASQKVRRVLAENSELRELWEENKTEFPTWREGALDLCLRLNG